MKKIQSIKRFLSLILAMITLISFLPITALAEGTEGTTSSIIAFDELEDQIRQQSVPYGQASSELFLPESLTAVTSANESVTVAGVTWMSSPDYDGNAAGSYTFRAILPTGYVLADGASLPEISVTVEEEASDENILTSMGSEGATSVTTAEQLNTVFQNGGSAVLESNITLSAPLVVPLGKTVTLDLNGKTIDRGLSGNTASYSGNAITVTGSLTLSDSIGSGKITGGMKGIYIGGGGIYVNGGTFVMNSGSISGNTTSASGGGVFVESGSFEMNGGSVSDNTSANGGGGICVGAGGTFTMSAGGISGNTTAGNGGGVYANEGAFIMNGGTISGNTAAGNEVCKGFGGGVSVMFGGSFIMHNGEISGNTAEGYSTMFGEGGGVYIDMSGIFTMDGGKINGNKAYYGGGVYLDGSVYNSGSASSFTMSAGEISENTTDFSSEYGNGGGIYVAAHGDLSISGSRIIRNSAGNGGGIYMLNGTCTMVNSEISENTTFNTLKELNQGGGVFVGGGTFTMKSGEINLNKAANGGGVYVPQGGFFIMETGQINENNTYALEYLCNGGGVYLSGTFSMKGGEIRGNATSAWNMFNHGGGVYVYGGAFKVSGDIAITDNSRSGVQNNVYLKTDAGDETVVSQISIVGELTGADGAIGISISTAPEGTTSLIVAQGVNYTIGDNDFKKFTRDTSGTLNQGDNKINLLNPNTSYLTFLSYNSNGGSGSHSSSAIVEGNDENIEVASVDGFSRVNCSFSGWNTAPDGSGTAYQPGGTFVLTENTVLYAQWTINTAELTATAPNGGAAPSASAVCIPSGVTTALVWKQGTNPLAGSFDYNTVYSAEITLTVGSGCKFSDSAAVTINGMSATVTSRSDSHIEATYTFDKTGPRSAPTAELSPSGTIDVENTGGSQTLTLNVADIIEGYNPVTWKMSKTEDSGNILTLPSTTIGTLSNGSLSLGGFILASNSPGHPAKSATVTISFEGNENGEYAGIPLQITVTFRLAAGDEPEAVLDFSNEKITGVTSEMEYLVDDSDSAPGNWTGATVVSDMEISLNSIVPDAGLNSKYIHIRFKGLNGEPRTIEIPARPDLVSFFEESWDSWVTYNIYNDVEMGAVYQDFGYRINNGMDMLNDSGGELDISLAPGATLTFWQPASASNFKSAEITVTAPLRLEKPDVAIDFLNKSLLNINSFKQYRLIDTSDWTDCEKEMALSDFGWNGTAAVSVQFRYPNTDDNYASETQTLSIPALPTAPTINCTSTSSTITVTSEAGVRYRLDGGEWKTGDENGKIDFTGLAANHSYTIDAQKVATASTFQSEAASLSVSTNPLADGTGGVSMDSWTYGGAAANPVPFSVTNGIGSVTYSYAGTKADGTVYSSSTKPTDAGSYTVTAIFGATSEYKPVTSAAAVFTIVKKEIEIQWKDLTAVYDGTPKSPTFTLIGVESGDVANISAQLSENKTNAGSYSVMASLIGSRAFNYKPSNPSGTLVIQKVPVTFSITGDDVQYDGGSHTAIVAAEANVSGFTGFNIIYKNSKGEPVLSPTDAGSYSIYALIKDVNYRHADATNGSAKKIGVLTIYTSSAPDAYTVSFSRGDGAVGSVAPLAAAQAGTLRILPDSTGMTNGTKLFSGWEYGGKIYQPGESLLQPASGIILTAIWTENTYSVGGVVYQGGNPLPDAVVTLMRGCVQVGQTVSGAGGEYSFADAAPGLYNLVASKNGTTQTVLVEIVQNNLADHNIILPLGRTNSVVEVDAGSPAIVVGNLEKTFSDEDKQAADNGSTVEMRLNAKAVEGTGVDQAAIDSEAGGTVGIYLELNLTKTVTPISGEPYSTNINQTNVLLEIFIQIPGELQGKDNYIVYRCHDGKISTLTTTQNNGEFITVNADKTAITIHAKLFSTYAIGYTVPPIPVSDGNDSSYTITPSASEGGSVAPMGRVTVSEGGSKTFTITAKDGYAVSDVLVDGKSVGAVVSYTFFNVTSAHTISAVFTKAKGLPYYIDAKGSRVFIGFAAEIAGEMEYIAPEGKTVQFTQNAKTFADTNDHWAKSYITFVAEREIFVGTGDNLFSPDNGMTRAMFVTIIGRLYERSYGEIEDLSDHAFDDCDYEDYYGKYVGWAAKEGIIEGDGNGKFEPYEQITRQEMAKILYRFADYLGVLPSNMDTTLTYADSTTISSWAKNAALYCQSTGIVIGRDDGSFSPNGTATRAEAATTIARFVESIMA
ncbi:MAG: S-layer homology domain-containing protein [Clostridiaceae bacterium]|nr:S-layer homology domain-containing protein [Clostridiaceae bacterium]